MIISMGTKKQGFDKIQHLFIMKPFSKLVVEGIFLLLINVATQTYSKHLT